MQVCVSFWKTAPSLTCVFWFQFSKMNESEVEFERVREKSPYPLNAKMQGKANPLWDVTFEANRLLSRFRATRVYKGCIQAQGGV